MFQAPEFEAPLLTDPAPPVRLHRVGAAGNEPRRADVVVIGGGLAGLCSALFMAREGADVLVVERDEAGMAASTANAGSLHVQLLSYDFDEHTPEDGGPAAYTLPLAPRSIALWQQIAAEAGEDLGIRAEGGLMLAEDEAGLDWLRRKSSWSSAGASKATCSARTSCARWRRLCRIAWSGPISCRPRAMAIRCAARWRCGCWRSVPARACCAARRCRISAGQHRVAGRDVKGPIVAGKVVNAAGPWSARIGRMVGVDLPVTGTVQQVIVTEPAPPMTRHLIAVANRHLSLKQAASGGFLVGGGWFGEFDPETGRTRNLRRSIEGNLWVCGQVLPALHGLRFIRSWTGINSAIDRAPILGETPGLPGFFNAVSANGYTLGPIIGRITADAVLRRERVDPHYTLERFG